VAYGTEFAYSLKSSILNSTSVLQSTCARVHISNEYQLDIKGIINHTNAVTTSSIKQLRKFIFLGFQVQLLIHRLSFGGLVRIELSAALRLSHNPQNVEKLERQKFLCGNCLPPFPSLFQIPSYWQLEKDCGPPRYFAISFVGVGLWESHTVTVLRRY
jgi:hypothetical protein